MLVAKIFTLLEIVFFSIVVSLDNAILIGLLTKDMDNNKRKKASFFGALLGVVLRLILAFIFYFVLVKEVSIIYIIGGVFVIIAGLLVINDKDKDESEKNIDNSLSMLKVVASIFLVDAMLSFDNSIAIADQVTHITNAINNNKTLVAVSVIIFCTLISFPIVYFGATSLSKVLNESKALVYISSYLLVSVGIGMFMEDPIFGESFESLNIYLRLFIQYFGSFVLMGSLEGFNYLLANHKKKSN